MGEARSCEGTASAVGEQVVNPLDATATGRQNHCKHSERGGDASANPKTGISAGISAGGSNNSQGDVTAVDDDTTNNASSEQTMLRRDLVTETAGQTNNKQTCINKREGGGGRTSGDFGVSHRGLVNRNDDWFRVIGPEPARNHSEDLFCTIWVVDSDSRYSWTEHYIDIFNSCTLGYCDCVYMIDGALVQIKPCRVFSECFCRGDIDPDWEYVLRGTCFGYRVIDESCDSTYNKSNYGSITKGEVGVTMCGRLQAEIDEQFLTVVAKPCVCIHGRGAVPKGHDDFREIVDCSSPDGSCVNDYTQGCRANFCYNSVESVTELLQMGGLLSNG